MILAIDPGPEESAYALLDENLKPILFGKEKNETLLKALYQFPRQILAIEMVASYGMPVGKEIFETVFWIGRFWENWIGEKYRIYRKEVVLNLCQSSRGKDSNVRQALIDRFGPVGTKKNKGWFYGVSGDVWSAIAIGVTFADNEKVLEKMAANAKRLTTGYL